jgi:NADP-dependent 3-hydroxy acid dehydrogenase YdfG
MAQQQAAGSGTATTPGKVWFITGASRGFGRIWTEAALQRGDKVAATARTLASLADLQAAYGANVLTLWAARCGAQQCRLLAGWHH